MLPFGLVTGDVIQVREYTDASGLSPFGRWFSGLNSSAAAKVTIALYRLAQGNFSNVKGVGEGVHEYKIDFGPGYRVYFGKDGDRVAILLGGSDKKGQAAAIAKAHLTWASYKQMKSKNKKS